MSTEDICLIKFLAALYSTFLCVFGFYMTLIYLRIFIFKKSFCHGFLPITGLMLSGIATEDFERILFRLAKMFLFYVRLFFSMSLSAENVCLSRMARDGGDCIDFVVKISFKLYSLLCYCWFMSVLFLRLIWSELILSAVYKPYLVFDFYNSGCSTAIWDEFWL